jgi:hypothetical protein
MLGWAVNCVSVSFELVYSPCTLQSRSVCCTETIDIESTRRAVLSACSILFGIYDCQRPSRREMFMSAPPIQVVSISAS